MIAQTIQLALAPVFLLVAIGSIMNILTTRYGRVVDRSRELQRLYGETSGAEHQMIVNEIRATDKRIVLIGSAMKVLVMSGLAVGLTVTLLFFAAFVGEQVFYAAAAFFLIAIALLMWGLLHFLRETQLAASLLRIPRELLELERKG